MLNRVDRKKIDFDPLTSGHLELTLGPGHSNSNWFVHGLCPTIL